MGFINKPTDLKNPQDAGCAAVLFEATSHRVAEVEHKKAKLRTGDMLSREALPKCGGQLSEYIYIYVLSF